MKLSQNMVCLACLVALGTRTLPGSEYEATLDPLVRVVDLQVGEISEVRLSDGNTVDVELISVDERRDTLRQAVRKASVIVRVNGRTVRLVSATYHLPREIAGVQIDCPVTKGYASGSSEANVWGLDKAARFRLWPADSPWIRRDTFQYPARQIWFATQTQMANEPVYVDAGEVPSSKQIYYHDGLDIGGAEGMVEVVAATDGLIVSARGEVLKDHREDTPVQPREDVVYLLDRRGWYYRYSHLHTIDRSIEPGVEIKMGDRIGILGKEGASGGWSHLHLGIDCRQPSGKWGATDGYAFLWQAYLQQYQPKLMAVARPHHLAAIGEEVLLDGSKSWSAAGKITSYMWLQGERRIVGRRWKKVYDVPGTYCEILRVRDSAGNIAYDFAEVQVLDPAQPERLPPTIHPAYWPTTGIHAGDEVTFQVRSFRSGARPTEIWDFGDGTAKVAVHSDGNSVPLAKDGYALTHHRFAHDGDYLVSVETTNPSGDKAVGRLHVHVAPAEN